jgi:integration host factor subunit alpha
VIKEKRSTLAAGENVKLSLFGSVTVRDKGERVGRNLKTKAAVHRTPPRHSVECSPVLRRHVNDGCWSLT